MRLSKRNKAMGRMMLIVFALALASVTGCAPEKSSLQTDPIRSVHLLFDAYPSSIHAGDLIYGGQWPSTFSRYQREERLYYQETLNDLQGRWPNARDYTLRRFQLRRYGTANR